MSAWPAPMPWRCTCGHSLANHACVRVAGAPGGQYRWGACLNAACSCTAGHAETDPPLVKAERAPLRLAPATRSTDLRLGVRWEYEHVEWGSTECHRRRCSAHAELLFDGLPLCLDCADELLERVEAMEIHPTMAAMLPSWDE